MRSMIWCGCVLGLVVVLAGPTRADDDKEMHALVDKALKAAGGADKLAKFKACTFKGKGNVTEGNKEGTFTAEGSFRGGTHWRMEMEANVDGQNRQVILVFDGQKAWARPKDRDAMEAPEEAIAVIKELTHVMYLAQTLAPLKGKDYKLAPLGEVKINDRATLGMKVTPKDRKEINLYFDKETGHLAKCEMNIVDMKDGQEVSHEYFFSDHKDMDGVKHFSKIVFKRDGKKFFDAELSEVKAQDKLDDNLFVKP